MYVAIVDITKIAIASTPTELELTGSLLGPRPEDTIACMVNQVSTAPIAAEMASRMRRGRKLRRSVDPSMSQETGRVACGCAT